MKYIKFLFLSLAAVVAIAYSKPDLNEMPAVQRFPDAAYYQGDLTEQVGEEQSTFLVHAELHKLMLGGYSLSIGDVGTDIQHEPQYILFSRVDGELLNDKVVLTADNIAGKINLDEHIFTSLSAELTKDRAVITLDFGNDRVWTCDVPAEIHMLE
jgi:hypothetical protein